MAKASMICWDVQAAEGCSVTLKCSTSRRRCSSTTNTNSTFIVIVGTVKSPSRPFDQGGCAGMSSRSGWAVAATLAEAGRRSVPRSRCQASSTRREPSVRAIADWPQPSHQSDVESRLPSRVCRDVAGSFWKDVPRTCEIARAASGRRYRPGRRSGESASASTAGRVRPRIVGRGKSERVVSVFAGRPRVEGGAPHSPPRRPHDR